MQIPPSVIPVKSTEKPFLGSLCLSSYFASVTEVWPTPQSHYEQLTAEAEMRVVLDRITPCALTAAALSSAKFVSICQPNCPFMPKQ